MHRTRSVVSILALLAALVASIQPGVAAQGAGTALVQVTVATPEDLARFQNTGLPAYTSPWSDTAGFVLTGAGAAAQRALSQAGLVYRILDPDMAGASYYFVYPSPGRALDGSDYGQVLLETAAGVLLRTSPEHANQAALAGAELKRLTFTPKPLQAPSSEQVFPDAVIPDPLIQGMMDQVLQADVVAYDRQLAGELPVWVDGAWYTITTRQTNSGTPIQKTTSWIGQQWAALGLDVEYHVWSNSTNPNVIGELPGLANPENIFIIGGHVDDVSGTPGADDNASGAVAAMIAADILTQYQWGCTLRFAVWTGEEQGLLGSDAYAYRASQQGENIVGYLNLDMIAWNTPSSSRDIDLLYSSSRPPTLQLAQLEADVIDAYNINLIPQLVTSLGGGSDHSSFWDYGYTAILSIEDQGDFNPYYHGSGDTPAHTDPGYFTDFVKASVGTLAHMSGCLIPSGVGAIDGHVTAAGSGAPIAGATLTIERLDGYQFFTTTNAGGYYTRTLMAGTYTVTASHPQYESAAVGGVSIVTDTLTTVDFSLTPRGRLWGYVTDADNGFGLAATVAADDGSSTATDPDSGFYELYLDEGLHTVTATAANYAAASAAVTLVAGADTREDFSLLADVSFVPKPVHEYVVIDTTATATANLLNRRGTPYAFQLFEIPGGYSAGLDTAWPGPDGFGYAGEAVDYNWIDIRTGGTLIPGLDDDSFAGPFNLGFTFPLYGANYTQFYVSSNGFVSFGSGSDAYTNDCPVPDSDAPNNAVYLMWDDLYPNYSSGGLYYRSYPTCPVGVGSCLVVEYYNWYHCCSTSPAGTFEAILFDNGSVQMQYQDTGAELGSGSTTATEGSNVPGNHGLQYACNAASSLSDGLSLCYAYPGSSGCIAGEVPWLGETPLAGTVPANGSLPVTLSFSATAAAGITRTGDYYATLLVQGAPQLRVPVTMTVVDTMQPPQASFVSSSPGCEGVAVAFTNTSDLGLPHAEDFLWTFGDGFTSTLESPAHTYTLAGSYTVTLWVCNPAGCDHATGTVEVLEGPEAAFSSLSNQLTVTFTNASTAATSYLWTFGDGGTSAQEHPVHTYAAPGVYTVTLTAYGCGQDQAMAQVTVQLLPQAGFTADTPGCLGQAMAFTSTSSSADTFLWDFADSFTSTLEYPTHTYSLPGSYTVTLTVCNDLGCDAAAGLVQVLEPPQAEFTFGVDFLTVTFANASTSADSYLWAFGDGETSTQTNPIHVYAAAGTYTVTLAASGLCGEAVAAHPVTAVAPAWRWLVYLPVVFRGPTP